MDDTTPPSFCNIDICNSAILRFGLHDLLVYNNHPHHHKKYNSHRGRKKSTYCV